LLLSLAVSLQTRFTATSLVVDDKLIGKSLSRLCEVSPYSGNDLSLNVITRITITHTILL
jgi:hypothetical protein